MPFDFDYSNLPLPGNRAGGMGIIHDHPNSTVNYGVTDPNAGHLESFHMRRDLDYTWAST